MAQIKSIKKIYGDGRHNAFTDIEYWKGHYYVSFRNAGGHVHPGDHGKILIIRSSDLSTWKLCKQISTKGDDRDPKLLNMGKELGVFFGSSLPKEPGQFLIWKNVDKESGEGSTREVQSYAAFTSAGTAWSSPCPIYEHNFWLWQVEHLQDFFYGTAYNHEKSITKLARSVNGRDWKTISVLSPNGIRCSEAGLWITEKERMYVVIRRGSSPAFLAQSEPPYKKWKFTELNYTVQASIIRPVEDKLWVAGRAYSRQLPLSMMTSKLSQEKIEVLSHFGEPFTKISQDYCTAIWQLIDNHLEPILVLPSIGDCAYPGLLVEKDRVLMSYYSQHDIDKGPEPAPGEIPNEIYLAEIIP